MAEELHSMAPPAPRGRSWTAIVLVALLAFLLGGGAVAVLAVRAGFGLSLLPAAHAPTLPTPTPSPTADPLAARAQALEQRLDDIDARANAAAGNAARSEALLVAFATRRAIERGLPLGVLEDQLRLRFGDAQPRAVATLIATAKDPITADMLSARLQAMVPRLVAAPPAESALDRVQREIAGLFVIRRGDGPAPLPETRADHALACLREGRVDCAIGDVQRLPDAAAAQGWIAQAHRYADAQAALDQIETTALLEPHTLNDGAGKSVDQASPLAATAASSAAR